MYLIEGQCPASKEEPGQLEDIVVDAAVVILKLHQSQKPNKQTRGRGIEKLIGDYRIDER
jgi:hypothetical protein